MFKPAILFVRSGLGALLLCAALASALPTVLSAQDDSQETVFAPFVSRLRVAVREPQIRLTWQDIPNFSGTYLVYRSTAEIGTDNLDKAQQVAEVKQGDEFYTDVPEASGAYFYAVLAKDNSGSVYKIFIPFRNKTLQSISISVAPKALDLASDISNFKATLAGSAIQVDLVSSRNTRTLTIFRGTKPLLTLDDVNGAAAIWSGTGRTISYADYAVPGVPYYYAAVDIDAFQKGIVSLVPDKNSLSYSVEIPLGTRKNALAGLDSPRMVRVMPLPVLTLPDLDDTQVALEGTNPMRITGQLDDATRTRIAMLTASMKNDPPPRKPAELLPSDELDLAGKLSAPIEGERKILTEILTKNFTKSNWDESIRQLSSFLTLPLSHELQAKGHFYLAQSYYQIGRLREALLEFLYVQDDVPEFAQTWIDNTLNLSGQWKN